MQEYISELKQTETETFFLRLQSIHGVVVENLKCVVGSVHDKVAVSD